jgi:hypothetical protein
MKKIVLLFSLLLFAGVTSSELIGQCDPENFSNSCIPKLATGFNFLKSYKIDGQSGVLVCVHKRHTVYDQSLRNRYSY